MVSGAEEYSSGFKRIPLGWDSFILDRVSERLYQRCLELDCGNDLSAFLIVVPTAECGRLLRESLALQFDHLGGVLSMNVTTPSAMLTPDGKTANSSQVLAAWLKTLTSCTPGQFPHLLKGLARYAHNHRWLLGVAAQLQQCRESLAAEGLSTGMVRDRFQELGKKNGSEELWNRVDAFREFAELEEQYLQALPAGVSDLPAAQLHRITDSNAPAGVRTIIFAACPDPIPAASRLAGLWMERGQVEVELWIAAPQEALFSFDGNGRPLAECWEDHLLNIDPAASVRKYKDSTEQARKLIRMYLENPEKPSAMGVLDPEISDRMLELTHGHEKEFRFYVPLQKKLSELPYTRTMLDLLEFGTKSPAFNTAAALARHAVLIPALEAGLAAPDTWSDALAALDRFQNDHLVNEFAELVRLSEHPNTPSSVRHIAMRLEEWRSRLAESKDPLWTAWQILSEASNKAGALPGDKNLAAEEVRLLGELIAEIRAVPELSPDLHRLFLLRRADEVSMPVNVDPGAITDLAGFLELPWRTDEILVVAGMNEEMFSSGPSSDPLLPDHARTLLGITDRKFRFAVQVYRMNLLLQPRTMFPGGGVICLYGRTSQTGDVLKPSRLLLQCEADELPKRAKMLFSDALVENVPAEAGDIPEQTIFQLPAATIAPKLSVTQFKAYLACPFRFYFDQLLNTHAQDDRAVELDNMQFGNVAHYVLQRFGESEYRDSVKETEIAEFCLDTMRRYLRGILGQAEYGVPKLQLEILSGNLQYFAALQAQLCEAGWHIAAVERKISFHWNELYAKLFPDQPEEEWRSKVVIRGKIDRIDRNDDGAWRIIDYKTNSASKNPAEEHVHSFRDVKDKEWRIAYANLQGHDQYWTDLQLPLYVLALKKGLVPGIKDAEIPDHMVEAGYINLPLALSDTCWYEFANLKLQSVLESAAECADQALHRIFVEHCFWPPAHPNMTFDDLCGWIGMYNEESFDPAVFQNVITLWEEEVK